jgi:hypothetical protein
MKKDTSKMTRKELIDYIKNLLAMIHTLQKQNQRP